MKHAHPEVVDAETGESVTLSPEKAAMLDEAIAEADADPDSGVTWEEMMEQLRLMRERHG